MRSQETAIYAAVIISSVILGIIIVFFIISLIKQQRRNLELHRLNILAEITALEKERSRIAADLHDDFAPMLSSIKFRIDSITTGEEEDQQQLRLAVNHLDDLIVRLREVSYNLMPSALLRKGLLVAVEEFLKASEHSNSLSIRFQYYNLPEISAEKSIHIFRILQELVYNTVKHAKASELSIHLQTQGNILFIQTVDNGIGFSHVEAVKENKGLGLRNLESRAEIMGGSMNLNSRPGKGTSFLVKIPL